MKIYETKVRAMRPTQVAVGYAEVEEKKHKLSKLNEHELRKHLKENPLPAVAGPDGKMYLTDHHHLGRALTELGIETCYFKVDLDLSEVPEDKFFSVLEVLELVHPFDENGVKVPFSKIPKRLESLKNDPYRALAGFVRKGGGYQKVNKPYLEFQWADFFRNLISKEELEQDIQKCVVIGIHLAQSEAAKDMLGWVGEVIHKVPPQKKKKVIKSKSVK